MKFKNIYLLSYLTYILGWIILAIKLDPLTFLGFLFAVGGGLVFLFIFMIDKYEFKRRRKSLKEVF